MGEVEIWKPIFGYEGLYEVSNLGNVKSLERKVKNPYAAAGYKIVKEKLLALTFANQYLEVSLYKENKRKHFRVHQLVAFAFLDHKPCGFEIVVNHLDFNKTNNRLDNLELVTNRENSNKKHLKSTSKFTGVSKHRNKWRASISLGSFATEREASDAYQKALKNIL